MKASIDKKISDYKTYLTEEIVGMLETNIKINIEEENKIEKVYSFSISKYALIHISVVVYTLN